MGLLALDVAVDPLHRRQSVTRVPVPRVALLISGLMYGGGQQVVLDLLRVAPGRVLGALELWLLGESTKMRSQPASVVLPYNGRYNSLRTLLSAVPALRRTLQARTPDILHTHGWDADLIGALACRGLPVHRTVHLHVAPEWLLSRRFRHRARALLAKWLVLKGATVLAVSHAVRLHWCGRLGLHAETIGVVHNGVDVQRFRPIEPGTPVEAGTLRLGVAARLSPMKGIEILIEALARLASKGLHADLSIAGDGELRDTLQSRVEASGLTNQVTFLGHVADMPRFYRSLDVLVLPSVSTEGFPLAVLEAMACGLPVVASNVSGIPEGMRDRTDGILVPPGDPQALADALMELSADPGLRKRMGSASRQRVTEKFSLEHFADAIHRSYRHITRVECTP